MSRFLTFFSEIAHKQVATGCSESMVTNLTSKGSIHKDLRPFLHQRTN